MRTRLRFTTLDGKPLTYEAGGKRHTMDRVLHSTVSSTTGALFFADYHRRRLADLSGIPYDDIQIHLDPLTAPNTDAAEFAALLGD